MIDWGTLLLFGASVSLFIFYGVLLADTVKRNGRNREE